MGLAGVVRRRRQGGNRRRVGAVAAALHLLAVAVPLAGYRVFTEFLFSLCTSGRSRCHWTSFTECYVMAFLLVLLLGSFRSMVSEDFFTEFYRVFLFCFFLLIPLIDSIGPLPGFTWFYLVLHSFT